MLKLKPSKRLIKSGNSFTLRGVRRSHAGKYVCRIETSPAIELIHTLDVQYPATVRCFSHSLYTLIVELRNTMTNVYIDRNYI